MKRCIEFDVTEENIQAALAYAKSSKPRSEWAKNCPLTRAARRAGYKDWKKTEKLLFCLGDDKWYDLPPDAKEFVCTIDTYLDRSEVNVFRHRLQETKPIPPRPFHFAVELYD